MLTCTQIEKKLSENPYSTWCVGADVLSIYNE